MTAVVASSCSGNRGDGAAAPLEELLGGPTEQAQLAYSLRVDEHIGQCMRNAGFEYTPAAQQLPEPLLAAGDLTAGEYAQRFGYGITATHIETPIQPRLDRQTEYVVSLSEVEHAAYQKTLVGDELADVAFIAPGQGPPLAEQGCYGQAVERLGGTDTTSDEWAEFQEQYAARTTALLSLPAMVTAGREWAECMTVDGWQFATPSDARPHVQQRLDAIVGPTLTDQLDDLTDAELDAFLDGAEITDQRTNVDDLAALDDLQREEIAIAVADNACFNAHVADVWNPLRIGIETDLAAEYRPLLETISDENE